MLHFSDIHLRDPYILADHGKYYLYGTRGATCWADHADGFDVYTSTNLMEWSEPKSAFSAPNGFWADRHFWAPEVHFYQGRYYMLASFKSETACRGTQILVSDTPEGPFRLHSDGPVTPRDWECLDGTLFVEGDGTPYMVFCHEWLQVRDGEMCALPLTADLRAASGEPTVLFRASEPDWAYRQGKTFVTDGPFLYRTKSGALLMLWSSSRNGVYCEAISRSSDGTLFGTWTHDSELLFSENGGHGMVFRDLEDRLLFTFHQPNETPLERPQVVELTEDKDTLRVKNTK